MGKKLFALLFAAGIIISGIRVIQGQFKIGGGKPLTPENVRPNIQTYIFQNLYTGANSLRSAAVKLPKIPLQISDMYDELASKRPEIQQAIHELQQTINSLDELKNDVEKNTPLSSIREPLMHSIATLQTTLPILVGVFRQLDEAIVMTVGEKTARVTDLLTKVNSTMVSIQNRDPIFNRDLPQRMDALADFLKTLNV